MKKEILLLGVLVGSGVIAGVVTSREGRQRMAGMPGRMMGWMIKKMPEE